MIRPATREAAAAILRHSGYQQLGDGTKAMVLAQPQAAFVVKLFSADDHAFARFVALTRAHPNHHWPIWRSALMPINQQYSAIRLERLLPLTPGEYLTYLHRIGGKPAVNIIQRALLDPAATDWQTIATGLPELHTALCLIVQHLLGESVPDVNFRNVMHRADGTLVLTDPVTDRRS